MPEQPGQPCEVQNCAQPAAGSYLHLGSATSDQFAVCEAHLAQLKAGARPSVVADPAEHDARPVLLLEPATADQPTPTRGAPTRTPINGSD
jgi:hypothetical protein